MGQEQKRSITEYLQSIDRRYRQGNATEHSYRGDLENLLTQLCPHVRITNEPKREGGNAPDYIITHSRGKVPIGWIEAKDIGVPLDRKALQEQFNRYKKAYPNLIITDYLDFHFYRNGEKVGSISIAKLDNGKITPLPENYGDFIDALQGFCLYVGRTVNSASKLSEMMATLARQLANEIENALQEDKNGDTHYANTTLRMQMEAFRQILIHDITEKQFADVYAQTITYGLLAARLHDPTLQNFSRQEALELIPTSNPFLRNLFIYIAGPIDSRIEYLVDDLATVFLHTDVKKLLSEYGKATGKNDPILHFYETFLGHYDPKLRKVRGVWYTPEPVVQFIVRAIDDLLIERFHIVDGLADTATTTVKIKTAQGGDKRYKDGYRREERTVPRLQILDPATGTGTFLTETIKHLYRRFEGQEGIWSDYVSRHLIPRLNGFELLMAPYAIAHLKLELLLDETGYRSDNAQRLRIFLTNSLEKYSEVHDTLFTPLAIEARQANEVKRDMPIMVVLGNPPYSGHSANKGEWIEKLMEDYKQEPGGGKLREKNPKWLNDDYVKFIRYAQDFIERNGQGIIGYINPHGYLDNPTFRGMRYKLLEVFDEIYVIDLHGNTNKKEKAPDGGKDENVFDIRQGVSINLFVKTGKKEAGALATVHHYDLYGKRQAKYDFLDGHGIFDMDFTTVAPKAPQYYFVPRDVEAEESYLAGLSLEELFPVKSTGVVTARDHFTIQDKPEKVWEVVTDFITLDPETAREKYDLRKDVRDWQVALAQEDIRQSGPTKEKIVPIDYRPFDTRYTYYTGHSKGFHCMPRGDVMRHMLVGENIGLVFRRQQPKDSVPYYFITNHIISDGYIRSDNKGGETVAPLYSYPEKSSLNTKRIPNLNNKILDKIANGLDLKFVPEKNDEPGTFSPVDLLDYIYAVLHSPSYRETYADFLKRDYPRVPYPDDVERFWALAALGSRLRGIHLMQSPELSSPTTLYPVGGDNRITRKINKSDFEIIDATNGLGRVWINDDQYFDRIPVDAWNHYIGGYQPAQKWLKDRHGKTLGFEDVTHYRKIVEALKLTREIMRDIDGENNSQ